jgi:hypothetical protein
MPKSTLIVRDLKATPELTAKIDAQLTEVPEVAPGQLRKKGDWYYLTYHRIAKVKNFNPTIWSMVDTEVTSIKVAIFKMIGNKLLINGSKSDISEIDGYFQALAAEIGSNQENMTNANDNYSLSIPTVDLGNIIQKFEEKQLIEYVAKARMKNMEVTLGTVPSCMVNTRDFYDSVRKLIIEDPEHIVGIEIFLKTPAKTSVYYDTDGVVKISSKSDVDVEEMVHNFALLEI